MERVEGGVHGVVLERQKRERARRNYRRGEHRTRRKDEWRERRGHRRVGDTMGGDESRPRNRGRRSP